MLYGGHFANSFIARDYYMISRVTGDRSSHLLQPYTEQRKRTLDNLFLNLHVLFMNLCHLSYEYSDLFLTNYLINVVNEKIFFSQAMFLESCTGTVVTCIILENRNTLSPFNSFSFK